ncbi:hypothetical protein ACWIUA_00355 [Ursidibacter sp. B-7004-1]
MEQPQIIIQIVVAVPEMTLEKYSEHTGLSVRYLKDRIHKCQIPIMHKKGREMPVINVAKRIEQAFSQTY